MQNSQLKVAQSFNLRHGGVYRGDCPFCGGENTYSVRQEAGTLYWNCYRNSCRVGGRHSQAMSPDDVVAKFRQIQAGGDTHFSIPEHWVGIWGHERVLNYLGTNHCMPAVSSGAVECMYDPKQDRCVFLVKEGENYYDAVGRSLVGSVRPKWFRYGASNYGLLVRTNDTLPRSDNLRLGGDLTQCVVVEDAASACAVSSVVDCLALLGTTISPVHRSQLARYREVILTLDPDAIGKSLKFQKDLAGLCKVRIVLIPDDLKYFNPSEIAHILRRE